MFSSENQIENTSDLLVQKGYWPARAAKYLAEEKYSKAVELCKENIKQCDKLLSVSLIYGQALYYAGQLETASEHFFYVLTREPDNIVALKFLGDINYAEGDTLSAMTHYKKIFEIDPDSKIVFSKLSKSPKETTRVITLKKGEEEISDLPDFQVTRKIPFYTETIGDLYLNQGFPKLAYEVFNRLNKEESNSRLADKLQRAKDQILERESGNVKKKN